GRFRAGTQSSFRNHGRGAWCNEHGAGVRSPHKRIRHRMSQEAKRIAENGASSPVLSPAQKAKKEETDFPFAVAVSDVYEGPLDLLLDLIRKQDIDIYDIPIAKITAQYLGYVEKLRELDVNVAAEFIYMAAVLIHIKSKML